MYRRPGVSQVTPAPSVVHPLEGYGYRCFLGLNLETRKSDDGESADRVCGPAINWCAAALTG
jgi:hypothetical protein